MIHAKIFLNFLQNKCGKRKWRVRTIKNKITKGSVVRYSTYQPGWPLTVTSTRVPEPWPSCLRSSTESSLNQSPQHSKQGWGGKRMNFHLCLTDPWKRASLHTSTLLTLTENRHALLLMEVGHLGEGGGVLMISYVQYSDFKLKIFP